jgi:alcohol dehydrogenase class IV
MGATAFQRGLGAMHAMAHPIGAHHHTHHGLTNAVLMPYVLVFNRAQIEGRIAQLATAIGLGAFTDQPAAGFDAFLDWVLGFRTSLGIPRGLGELGVDTEAAVALAQEAAEDPSAGTNPRPLTAENLAPLLDAAARGDLDAAASLA